MFAMQRGMRVPDDLSIIAAGDASREGALRQRLSCITIDEDLVGRSAADLLQELTAKGDSDGSVRPTERILVPLGISEGETVARV